MRKLEQMAHALNDDLREQFVAAMAGRFDGLHLYIANNVFGEFTHERMDGEDYTPEQEAYADGWLHAFGVALDLVRLADSDSQRRG